MRGKTGALTVSALCAAADTVLLALSMVLPAQRLALLCLSSLGVVACLCTNGRGWALGTYGVTGLLSLLLLPDKRITLAYALFCGYYPVLKLNIEGVASAVGRAALKLFIFNLALCGFYYLAHVWTALPLWVPLLAANAAFWLYDFALGKLILLYSRKIAGRIKNG